MYRQSATLIFMMICLIYSSLSAAALSHDYLALSDSLHHNAIQNRPNFFKDKTPLKAFMIGLAPGIFIHGLGHYYIGENKAGTWLLVSEGASLLIICGSAISAVATIDCADCNRGNIEFSLYTGIALFFGGWIVDFVDAPIRLAKIKSKAAGAQGFSVKMKNKAVMLNYSVLF